MQPEFSKNSVKMQLKSSQISVESRQNTAKMQSVNAAKIQSKCSRNSIESSKNAAKIQKKFSQNGILKIVKNGNFSKDRSQCEVELYTRDVLRGPYQSVTLLRDSWTSCM